MTADGPAGGPVVFAIPRGGVAVAVEVARALSAPLGLLMVRKLGHPDAPELGLGAIAEDGAGGAAEPLFDQEMLAQVGLTAGDLTAVVERERAELARRAALYTEASAGRTDPRGRLAVVVDDGLATGVTARAALRAVRARGAARTILAVPVAAPAAVRAIEVSAVEVSAIEKGTGEVVTLVTPRRFRSVGEWYADFGQLTDADVLTLLAAIPKSGLGRVGAAHPAAALGGALVLVQATPGAVLLRTGNGVIQAVQAHRAARADLLGLALPDVPLRLSLAVWAKEEHQILATTRGSVLPPPVRAGKHGRLPTHLGHGSITSTKLLRSWVTLALYDSPAHEPGSCCGNCCCKLQRSTASYCSHAFEARLRALHRSDAGTAP
jgi:putative phosphoribosyl transferase